MARVEAFIAGWGLDEALKRSEAYLNAGADAILMHSKKSDPSDIESFVKAWKNQVSFLKYYFVILFHTLSYAVIQCCMYHHLMVTHFSFLCVCGCTSFGSNIISTSFVKS